jgi:hypothetical protein
MSAQIERWNRRAGYLLTLLEEPTAKDQPSPLDRARATLVRWQRLVATVPHRALSAAAHQGLEAGPVKQAVERLRRGCVTLAGTAGGGKTVGGAWLAYWGDGSVLWLDAVAVGQAHPDQVAAWRREIPGHDLVVLDDLGAGSSSGDWSSRKVADVLTAVLERSHRSVVALNLDRQALAQAMDGREGGRLTSRLGMLPNVWIDVRVKDRRPEATPPPDIDELPPREAEAQTIVQSRACLRSAHQAYAIDRVDVPALTSIAKALGFARWSAVDQAIAGHEQRMEETRAKVDWLTTRLRIVGPAVDESPEPGAAQRARVALLDLVANVAERRGCDERDVLADIGRTRKTLGPEDEPRLLALL